LQGEKKGPSNWPLTFENKKQSQSKHPRSRHKIQFARNITWQVTTQQPAGTKVFTVLNSVQEFQTYKRQEEETKIASVYKSEPEISFASAKTGRGSHKNCGETSPNHKTKNKKKKNKLHKVSPEPNEGKAAKRREKFRRSQKSWGNKFGRFQRG